jgi:hypothetical protein
VDLKELNFLKELSVLKPEYCLLAPYNSRFFAFEKMSVFYGSKETYDRDETHRGAQLEFS